MPYVFWEQKIIPVLVGYGVAEDVAYDIAVEIDDGELNNVIKRHPDIDPIVWKIISGMYRNYYKHHRYE